MAELWLSSSAKGNDDGTTYAHAWGDINKFYTYVNASGVKGDILNVINDGTHTCPLLTVTTIDKALAGTDYDTDPAFTIRGVADDDTGTAELATFEGQAASAIFMDLNPAAAGAKYISVKGLFLDLSTVGAANFARIVRMRDLDAGPVRFQACRIRGFPDSDANYSDVAKTIFEYTAGVTPAEFGEVSYCLLENIPRPQDPSTGKSSIHHNVIRIKNVFENVETGAWIYPTTAAPTYDFRFYNNTLYYDLEDTGAVVIEGLISQAMATGTGGVRQWHSNVVWFNSASTGTPVIKSIFEGSAGSDATFTGDIKSNVVQFGPDVEAGDVTAIYEVPWGPGGDDEIAYEIADTTLFVDPSTPYTWSNVNGTGYDLPLPADLRLRLYTAAGLGGILPGALPLGTTDYSVDSVVPSDVTPTEGDTIQIVATVSNTGPQATGVEFTFSIPSGLSYSSHSASLGTYDFGTGVWSIPTFNGGTSATLTITLIINAGTAGSTITATCAFSTGTPSDNNAANNSSSGSVVPVANDDSTDAGGGDPDDPATIPYINVVPFYTDVFQYNLNSRFSLEQNRVRLKYLRYDNELKGFREWATRQIVVDTSTTDEIITGIETAELIFLESDEPVQLNAGEIADVFLPEAKVVLLAGGEYSVVKVKNASATDDANTLITVVD